MAAFLIFYRFSQTLLSFTLFMAENKLYYSIGEVAKMFDVNITLIRFWEKEFSIIKPKKSKGGTRQFTQKDIDNFKLIYHLVKERGLTLKGAKKKLEDNPEDTIKTHEVVNRLQKIKEELKMISGNMK